MFPIIVSKTVFFVNQIFGKKKLFFLEAYNLIPLISDRKAGMAPELAYFYLRHCRIF